MLHRGPALPSPSITKQEIIPHCERWRDIMLSIPRQSSLRRSTQPASSPHKTLLGFRARLQCCCRALRRCASIKGALHHPMHRLFSLGTSSPNSPATFRTSKFECVSLLQKCPSIVDYSFITHDFERSMESITSLPPLVHYCITSLKIDGACTLELLSLPSLRVLRLELDWVPGANDTDILVASLARSGCQLESLCLRMGGDQALLRCLPFLASLVTLKIRTHHVFLINESSVYSKTARCSRHYET
ncbi:hypothetical protein K438DRAFT_1024002 [Mycena galopus ATCC 62051]|nr:hypothetical protein K438DRAFT_1024002 [Mycena galopus ATCC 62051]